MEGMYDWPYYYIPFETHDNYPPCNPPVLSRRPMPSPYMDGGYRTTPASRRMPPVWSVPKPAKQVVFRPSRSDYAVKIQKAFRGFRIRKNVSKILELKRGVDEVERGFMEAETVELIIRDDRYRLKVSETLMELLLKLDSIRGLNDAVRVCRKAVIRKAILLQERIDSLAAAAAAVAAVIEDETQQDDNSESQLGGKVCEIDENGYDESEAWECVDDGKVENVENVDDEEEDTKQGWLVVEEDKNRRLMEMIAELCNKNDIQTRLIQSLSERVEQLEQAMNDRITRKRDNKKKKKAMLMMNA